MGKRNSDDLVAQLFAEATALIEQAHEIAVEGQAPKVKLQARLKLARRLQRLARSINVLGDTVEVIIGGKR